jgi:hypothetical protein
MKRFSRIQIGGVAVLLLWAVLEAQLLASPVSGGSAPANGAPQRYALAGIGWVGSEPYVVLLDRIRGVPVLLTSPSSSSDRVVLEKVGRGFIRLRIDGLAHEISFTRTAPAQEEGAENSVSSALTIHQRRHEERLQLLQDYGRYKN